MGYYQVRLHKIISVPASNLGPKLIRHLEEDLCDAVEGQIIANVGLIVAILDMPQPHMLEGRALDTGRISFYILYDALVFHVFPNEFVDGHITEVSPESLIIDIGPATVYVSKYQLHPNMTLTEHTNTTLTDSTETGQYTLKVGDFVRTRIINEINHTSSFSINTYHKAKPSFIGSLDNSKCKTILS